MSVIRTRRFTRAVGLGAATALAWLGSTVAAVADPSPDLPNSLQVTLSCQDGNDYPAVVMAVGQREVFFAADGKRLVVKSLSIAEIGYSHTTPGFDSNGQQLVKCTFVGPTNGLHFTVSGLLVG